MKTRLASTLLIITITLALSLKIAQASSYGPDLTTTDGAIASDYYSTFIPANSVDNDGATYWLSNLSAGACSGVCWIGQDFGEGNAYEIRAITLWQANAPVNSVLVSFSHDASFWSLVETLTVVSDLWPHTYAIGPSQPARYWRVKTNTNPGARWGMYELEMMELIESPTNTPGPTLTPSITPSNTPDYFIEGISTQGAPFRLERAASFGDVLSTSAICVVGAIVTLGLFVSFWGRRPGNA